MPKKFNRRFKLGNRMVMCIDRVERLMEVNKDGWILNHSDEVDAPEWIPDPSALEIFGRVKAEGKTVSGHATRWNIHSNQWFFYAYEQGVNANVIKPYDPGYTGDKNELGLTQAELDALLDG